MPPVRKNKQGYSNSKRPTSTTKAEQTKTAVSGQLEKKIKKQQERDENKRGVVFLKHLPHGFFEEQLKNYFQQFGDVTRVRLGRSRRTGGSKGYAFVEFEYPEVAEVAAETMDNYLMFQKLVKASYIPPEKQIFNYFKTSVRKVKDKTGKEIYISNKIAAINRKAKQISNWSDKNYQKRTIKKLEKINKLNKKYAHLGIDFSKVLIEPKKIEKNEETQQAKSKTANKQNSTATVSDTEVAETKISKKELELKDLLGNTINDDSSDEDYIADEQSKNTDSFMDADNAESSSDEETYGFTKSSDDDDADGDGADCDKSMINKPKGKEARAKASVKYEKPMRGASKTDRFEKLIKRKPQTGAVKKAKKMQKPVVAKKATAKVTKSLQVKAAKEILKTQSTKKVKSAAAGGTGAKAAKAKKFVRK